MKDDQKRLRSLKGLAVLAVIILLGLVGWGVWHPKNGTSKTSTATVCSATIQTANKTSQLPDGWSWYEIKGIGLKYAYPKSWGSLITQTNTGSQKYIASFTVNSSGANTAVTLNPDCSDFQSSLSDINSGKFDILSGPTITKAIEHNQTSYSSLSHWSSDAGNQYKLSVYKVVSVGNIKLVLVDYGVVTGSEVCPDDGLASDGQPKCIDQSISDELNKIINSLQKI